MLNMRAYKQTACNCRFVCVHALKMHVIEPAVLCRKLHIGEGGGGCQTKMPDQDAMLMFCHVQLLVTFRCWYAEDILELTRSECEQCKDVSRLSAAISVLCQLAVCTKPVGSSALQALLDLVVNRYPKVCLLKSTLIVTCFDLFYHMSCLFQVSTDLLLHAPKSICLHAGQALFW